MRTFIQCSSWLLASSLVLSGCTLTPPPRPPEDERTLNQARRQQREAAEARQQLQDEHRTATTRIEQINAEIEALNEPYAAAQQEHRAQQLELDSYENRIEAALAFASTCQQQLDVATALETGAALAQPLANYVSEPARDKALKALDQCRTHLAKLWRKALQTVVVDLQREFAVEVEDVFDENNPYSRGGLTAKVTGTTLDVRMRGNFEGRARHSQDQVDAWCLRGDGLFTKITLRNSHGTFSCEPDDGPKQLTARLMEEAHASTSWYAVGDRPTPTPPDPLPPLPAEVEQRKTELLAELRQLQGMAPAYDERGLEIAEQEQQARASVASVDARDSARINGWRSKKIERAGHVQIAGGVFIGIGGAILVGSIGVLRSNVAGAKDALPIAIGVSVPVLVTGILLLTGGTVHKYRVRQAR